MERSWRSCSPARVGQPGQLLDASAFPQPARFLAALTLLSWWRTNCERQVMTGFRGGTWGGLWCPDRPPVLERGLSGPSPGAAGGPAGCHGRGDSHGPGLGGGVLPGPLRLAAQSCVCPFTSDTSAIQDPSSLTESGWCWRSGPVRSPWPWACVRAAMRGVSTVSIPLCLGDPRCLNTRLGI